MSLEGTLPYAGHSRAFRNVIEGLLRILSRSPWTICLSLTGLVCVLSIKDLV